MVTRTEFSGGTTVPSTHGLDECLLVSFRKSLSGWELRFQRLKRPAVEIIMELAPTEGRRDRSFRELAAFMLILLTNDDGIYAPGLAALRREIPRTTGEGFEEHGRKKGMFVYPVHRRAREVLSAPLPSRELSRRNTMPQPAIDVSKLPLQGEGGLLEVLRQVTDPRNRRGIRHPFESVLALAVMAALCGMRSYEATAEWAGDVSKDLLKRLRCWCARAPSEPTFRRVLRSIDADEVDRLHRHLDSELWGPAHFQKTVLLPHRSILGHVSSCLTHHPHRSALYRLVSCCTQKEIVIRHIAKVLPRLEQGEKRT